MTDSTARSQGAYSNAGVDIDTANSTKAQIAQFVRSTFTPGVIATAGGFGGVFSPPWSEYADPVLVSSVDGVGTKLKVAFASGIHDTVGRDIVSHCANDILVQGARPMFFMDYLALGSHDPSVVESVVRGVVSACRDIGCALLGGETAEMPGFYQPGQYDLAGVIVGIADRRQLISGTAINTDDVVIALASDGLHTNGFALARKVILEEVGLDLDEPFPGTTHTVAEVLLRPHRCYVGSVLQLIRQVEVHGLAHITGGGILDNVTRILPSGVDVIIERGSWQIPEVFSFIQRRGRIEEQEMYHVFNMGIGMVICVSEDTAPRALSLLREAGEDARVIGRVEVGGRAVRFK